MNQPARANTGSGWALWLEAARPRTLPAAIAPVLAASALAWHDGVFHAPAAFTCLAFALLIQIGTNYANDYFDFVKGADTAERVGPRRAVAAGLISPVAMRNATALVFATAFLVGLTLLRFGGWPLLLVGVLSILCGIIYTGGPYPLAYHGWGDVFVFVFFGLVAVTATYFVQAGQLSPEAWLVGTAIGALSTNILLVNNYRDDVTDAKAGKRTVVVRFGRAYARAQFAFCHLVAWTVVAALSWRGAIAVWAAAGLLLVGIVEGVKQSLRLRTATGPAELIALLAGTGKFVALFAILLSVVFVV